MIDTLFDTLFGTTNGRPAQVMQYVPVACCNCGVRFALDAEQKKKLVSTEATFYCPNGHAQHFAKPAGEADKLRAQLAKEARKRELLETQLRSEREWSEAETARRKTAERTLKTTKAAKTRLQNRIKNGVCPCCNRQFADLHRHMQGQHPEYAVSTCETLSRLADANAPERQEATS